MSQNHAPIRLDRFEAYLKDQNLSRTKPRRLLYKALAAAGPQTPPQLVTALDGQMDRATVYRTIDFFVSAGIAVRAASGAVELGEAFRPHHHHLVCASCGRSESVDDESLEAALSAAAGRHGFTLTGHDVELMGLCNVCQTAAVA